MKTLADYLPVSLMMYDDLLQVSFSMNSTQVWHQLGQQLSLLSQGWYLLVF
ncbi:hypothetical protein [Weissella cibaria]|uniref:hypothetical protein n=1 Tax=Weissella cibaria TaxID=137591 RepID=UPI000B0CD0DD|nr:hypothetical protein [Weissella cibaria]